MSGRKLLSQFKEEVSNFLISILPFAENVSSLQLNVCFQANNEKIYITFNINLYLQQLCIIILETGKLMNLMFQLITMIGFCHYELSSTYWICYIELTIMRHVYIEFHFDPFSLWTWVIQIFCCWTMKNWSPMNSPCLL